MFRSITVFTLIALTMTLPVPAVTFATDIGALNTFPEIETSIEVDPGSQAEVSENVVDGSAPLRITFTAEPPSDAAYYLWEISTDVDFNNVLFRYYEPEFTRTFTEAGSFFVRFTCNDFDGTVQWSGQTYIVIVAESSIKCPNAFTPYGSPGVNDMWKVKAVSIVDFDCVIFNGHGAEVAHLTDTEQGWDGTYRGKLVPPGVYYYVIKARGSEGRNYSLSGNINILKSTLR